MDIEGKGWTGCGVGVAVCVMEDQHQFILGYRVMWEEEDVDIAVDLVQNPSGFFEKGGFRTDTS